MYPYCTLAHPHTPPMPISAIPTRHSWIYDHKISTEWISNSGCCFHWVRLQGPIYLYRHRVRVCQIYNLPIKQSIGTMLNFDGGGREHGDGTCKQALISRFLCIKNIDCNVNKFGYNEHPFRTVTLASFYLLLPGPSVWSSTLIRQTKTNTVKFFIFL